MAFLWLKSFQSALKKHQKLSKNEIKLHVLYFYMVTLHKYYQKTSNITLAYKSNFLQPQWTSWVRWLNLPLNVTFFHKKFIKNPFFEGDIVIQTPPKLFLWNLYMTNITTYLNLLSIPHYLEILKQIYSDRGLKFGTCCKNTAFRKK